MLGALFLNHIDTAQVSSTSCKVLIIKVLAEGHDTRMGVVGVKHNELLLLLGNSI